MRHMTAWQFLFAGCLGLSPSILWQFILEISMRHSHKLQKTLKPPILGVQGYSKSSILTPLKSVPLLLIMISSMSVPICNRFYATPAN